jgi:hypothetical protein
MRLIIASFPRSGNHLVRGVVEFGFGRPTEGAPGRKGGDPPIADRGPNRSAQVIEISDRDPIGFKAHSLLHVGAHRLRFPDATGLVLVLRDPADAIASQLMRAFTWLPWLTDRRLRIEAEAAANGYLSLACLYRSWDPSRRWLVRFEELVGAGDSLGRANALLDAVGARRRLDAQRWEALKQVTRESQRALGRIASRRKERVRAAIGSGAVREVLEAGAALTCMEESPTSRHGSREIPRHASPATEPARPGSRPIGVGAP